MSDRDRGGGRLPRGRSHDPNPGRGRGFAGGGQGNSGGQGRSGQGNSGGQGKTSGQERGLSVNIPESLNTAVSRFSIGGASGSTQWRPRGSGVASMSIGGGLSSTSGSTHSTSGSTHWRPVVASPSSPSTQPGPSKPKTSTPMMRPPRVDLDWEREKIITNLFAFEFDKRVGVFQYKVKFDPVVLSKTLRRKVFSHSSLNDSSCYDGKEDIYSSEDVSKNEFAVYLQETDTNYKIKIESSPKFWDFTDSVVLKKHIGDLHPLMKMLAPQRKLPFVCELEPFELKTVCKRGLTVVGDQLQLRITNGVAICYMKGCVADFVLSFITSSVDDMYNEANEAEMIELENALCGCIVEVNYGHCLRHYKVASLSRESCDTLTFIESKSGKEITVCEYYKTKGNQLTRPELPAIIAEGGQYLPVEICHIRVDQSFPKSRYQARRSPNLKSLYRRLKDVMHLSPDARRKANVQAKGERTANFLSMAVGEEIQVEAHIIPPPAIHYSSEATTPVNGRWHLDHMRFYEASTVSTIGILNLSTLSIDDVRNFYGWFELAASRHDLDLPSSPQFIDDFEGFEGKNIELLLVILPRRSSRTKDTDYDHLKARCEHDLHCHTQFIRAESVEKYADDPGFYDRLASQVNAKLGSSNHSVVDSEFSFNDDTIILGADVTHPSTGDRFGCSVACLVGSLDFPRLVPYKAVYSAQTGEIINNIGDLFRDILLTYKEKRGQFPTKVIYFRDGVGHTDFSELMEKELTAIYSAYEALAGVRPLVTFIVCQKRCHTRLFKVTGTEGDVVDASPGTIVDDKICKPDIFDFYMLSHVTEKGTGRAVHYTVLQDDFNHGCKALYSLTHNLCYMYAVGTQATSIAAPLLYAHKAAFRTRSYLNDRLVLKEGKKVADVADVEPLLRLGVELRDTMYYL